MHGLVRPLLSSPFPLERERKKVAQRKKERDYPLSLSLNPVLDLVLSLVLVFKPSVSPRPRLSVNPSLSVRPRLGLSLSISYLMLFS